MFVVSYVFDQKKNVQNLNINKLYSYSSIPVTKFKFTFLLITPYIVYAILDHLLKE